jgi:hypothetical protein
MRHGLAGFWFLIGKGRIRKRKTRKQRDRMKTWEIKKSNSTVGKKAPNFVGR